MMGREDRDESVYEEAAAGRGIITGRVHSVQSLGAVDGPGLRSVVFLQGCPLRCAYCHNPDTWDFGGGTVTDAETLVNRLLRFKPYWGGAGAGSAGGIQNRRESGGVTISDGATVSGEAMISGGTTVSGGVTISGGEPLSQPEFTAEVFKRLHRAGVHTALDTSGTGNLKKAEEVLKETDLALVDIKFLSEEEYKKFCRGSFSGTMDFLKLAADMNVPVWIRHVGVPGLTAEEEYLRAVKVIAENLPNFENLEFLPFHNMCIEKYERMGIPFPLKDTKVMEPEKWNLLLEKI